MTVNSRTDMASESVGRLQKSRLPDGIETETENIRGFEIFHVRVKDASAGRLIGKPLGDYYTLQLEGLPRGMGDEFRNAAEAVGNLISRCLPADGKSCLIAALGNPDITPDALGPLCAEHILVTRHLTADPAFSGLNSAAVIRTGVLGTTGVESASQIKAICGVVKPDAVIAVDALAGAELGGLCRSVQVSTGGISPGSGVLNDRPEISAAFLGVPVIAVGVPTVADGKDLLDKGAEDTFLTPRDIDVAVRSLAKVIAYGINLAVNPGLSIDDIRELNE